MTQLHTKEFYEIMNVFEKSAKSLIRIGHLGFTKEPKENWINQFYYCDGNVNDSFKIFLSGVSLGRIL